MNKVVLTSRQISHQLREVLRLPKDAWQLKINGEFTDASFMDADCRIHQIQIDEITRIDAERALQPR